MTHRLASARCQHRARHLGKAGAALAQRDVAWFVRELVFEAPDVGHADRVRECFEHALVVGDSTNDQRMFEAFPHSVGVANIRRFEDQLTHKPGYITLGERGAGFAEVARALLATR